MEVEERIWEFTRWIYNTYGRIGCLVALLIILSVLGLTFYFLNKLPEPKKVARWTKCTGCKYKCSEKDTYVFECRHYKDAPIFPLIRPMCPHLESIDELYKLRGVGDMVLIKNELDKELDSLRHIEF